MLGMRTVFLAALLAASISAIPAEAGPFEQKVERARAELGVDSGLIRSCVRDRTRCTPASLKFADRLRSFPDLDRMTRVRAINRFVNLAVKPMLDSDRFGIEDVWVAPLRTLADGVGDCEDYAILKYAFLRHSGFASADVRLFVMKAAVDNHAVVAVRVDGRWRVLDNKTLEIVDADAMPPPLRSLSLD